MNPSGVIYSGSLAHLTLVIPAAALQHVASGGDANTSASALSDPANDSRSTSGGDDDSLPDAGARAKHVGRQ